MDHKKPYLAIVLIQLIYTGMYLLSKAAFNEGMNTFVFVFYRQAAATVFLAPLAIFFEWKKAPPLPFSTFCKIFMISFCGISLGLNINGVALVYTSATLASASRNCLPVITFFLALLFRIEMLKLKSIPGIAKVVGIAICTIGAAIMAFYRGPNMNLLLHYHVFHHHSQLDQAHVPSGQTWTKGVFLMLLSNTLWCLWLVLQAKVMKGYPSKLLFTTLQCFLSSIQTFIIAIAVERDPDKWKLGWNVKLLAVAYCGIVVTGVTFYLQAWVIEKKGPVFLALTTPLAFVFTIFCSVFLLGEMISLGSILGGICLVGGLYCVLWGKSKEQRRNVGIFSSGKESSDLKEEVPNKSPSPLPV